MKFDRNTVIGFVILAALFFGYFFYTNQEQAAYQKGEGKNRTPLQMPTGQSRIHWHKKLILARADSINKITNAGDFQNSCKRHRTIS